MIGRLGKCLVLAAIGVAAGLGTPPPNAVAEPASTREHRASAGAFIGGNYYSDELELGDSFFADQVPQSAFLLGLRGSYVLWDSAASGPRLGALIQPSLAVELEGKFAFSSTAGMPDAMRSSHFAPVLGWRAQAVLGLRSGHTLNPFATLGAGGETAFSGSPFVVSVDTDATLYWGLGALYQLAGNYGLRGDFRHGMTAARSEFQSNTLEFHLGFYYAFSLGGKVAETPPEPVVESVGKVTTEPMKPADSDGDGIPDDRDACPAEPEVTNEIDDDDGCPEVDSDGDGLLGTADQCPEEAEDLDGFEDDDGCPDRDNDGDGRSDRIDQCVLEPETMNGFEDDDGCPDEIPATVKQYTGVIKGIRFRSGSARIRPSSHRTLDKVVAILEQHPSVGLRISGHTDNRGPDKRNIDLSRKRADAVKWYLVDKGIDDTRFETVGHGPNQPRADNETRKGRAQNRRIEFELLPGPAELDPPESDLTDGDEAPSGATGASNPDGGSPEPTPGQKTGATPKSTTPASGESGERSPATPKSKLEAKPNAKAKPKAKPNAKPNAKAKAKPNAKSPRETNPRP